GIFSGGKCCMLFMMITPHASHACRLTMKNSSDKGDGHLFLRFSQCNNTVTVYGDVGASVGRNITLPDFAYASLLNCPSISILWQTHSLFVQPSIYAALAMVTEIGRQLSGQEGPDPSEPIYSEKIALLFSTIMGWLSALESIGGGPGLGELSVFWRITLSARRKGLLPNEHPNSNCSRCDALFPFLTFTKHWERLPSFRFCAKSVSHRVLEYSDVPYTFPARIFVIS
ncbi:hypothetical protein BDA96_01G450100, partial [Sorghum bicolor]